MVLIIIPFIASLLTLLFNSKLAKIAAIAASVVQLIVNFILLYGFNTKAMVMQYASSYTWFTNLDLNFSTGIDGIAMVMLLLTNIASVLIIVSTWDNQYSGTCKFLSLVLIMQGALNGVFLSTNGLMFYIFWELALIPIYFIVGIWGGDNRLKITFKFFIYTFLGSLLMLLALIFVYLHTPGNHSFEWSEMIKADLTGYEATLILWAFFIAFAIKMPVFPFHTWQADTYNVAPAQGSMLLSGIMLKMGIFGMIRWMWPMSKSSVGCNCNIYMLYNVFIILAVIGIIYAAIIAIKQNDIKRVIAWSSVSHVGLIAAGIMTWTKEGLQGGILQSFNHGINVIGLFFIAEIIDRRLKTRDIKEMGGLAKYGKTLALFFMIIMLGSVAAPFTNGFTGEFLLLNATFNYHQVLGIVSGLTIIFCAVYMLRVYQFSMFGPEKDNGGRIGKLSWSEFLTLGIIVVLVITVGFFPNLILDISESSVDGILTQMKGGIAK
ncbi:MAG: NuoM family protein [Bacteroidia bacterium]